MTTKPFTPHQLLPLPLETAFFPHRVSTTCISAPTTPLLPRSNSLQVQRVSTSDGLISLVLIHFPSAAGFAFLQNVEAKIFPLLFLPAADVDEQPAAELDEMLGAVMLAMSEPESAEKSALSQLQCPV